MGKWRQLKVVSSGVPSSGQLAGQQFELQLPPPPPLLPRPGLHLQQPPVASAFSIPIRVPDRIAKVENEEDQSNDEPLDYSMKSLMQPQPLPSPPSPFSMSASPMSVLGVSATEDSQRSGSKGSGRLLHKLRDALIQKGHSRDQPLAQCLTINHSHALTLLSQTPPLSVTVENSSIAGDKAPHQSAATAVSQHSEVEANAAYAANCIKSRLEGCGKRVHLFLGILLHFGMPPGPNGEQLFNRVISFSDEHKNLTDTPTAYFMVLDSKLLALVWSKFKGNTSNEYSTLTRAIRSTRQKYQGIFELVKNPGKKLYKFGPIAIEQFRNLFPSSYSA